MLIVLAGRRLRLWLWLAVLTLRLAPLRLRGLSVLPGRGLLAGAGRTPVLTLGHGGLSFSVLQVYGTIRTLIENVIFG